MEPPILERAIAILAGDPAVAMPLSELADRAGTVDAEGLAGRLAADPRVRVLGPAVLPRLSALAPERAAAYEAALTDAGLRPCRRVALLHRTPPSVAGVAELLQETTARLLGPGPDADRLAEAADRASRAIRAADTGVRAADPTLPVEAVPSTTPLPDPRSPASALR